MDKYFVRHHICNTPAMRRKQTTIGRHSSGNNVTYIPIASLILHIIVLVFCINDDGHA